MGITPACAGNTLINFTLFRFHEDHPRLRGEYISPPEIKQNHPGSPPLARGIQKTHGRQKKERRITPACAGNTIAVSFSPPTPRDHPRLRGEYFDSPFCSPQCLGSPPLARGILKFYCHCFALRGITPACAGNTLKKSLIYNLFPISISKFHLVSQTPEML